MAKLEKLLEGIRNNPKDVEFNEIKKILENYGYEVEPPRSGSSHWIFRKEGRIEHINIPRKKPIKVHYIKKALIAIDFEIAEEERVRKEQESQNDENKGQKND